MKIVIPTTKRAKKQFTVQNLLRGKISNEYKCFLAIHKDEIKEYEIPPSFKVIGLTCKGINNVRQYIIEHCSENKIVMMDDDLRFYVRPEPILEYWDLCGANSVEVLEMVKWIEKQLDDYAHCSISTRIQNFQSQKRVERAQSTDIENIRPYRIYGYRKDIVLGEELDFHAGLKVNTMDDFHMTLNLLELGYPNVVSFLYAHEQGTSNSEGGASTYRDLELLKKCALNLRDKHPEGLVKTVQRKTINSWGATKENPIWRTDVRIEWLKALGRRAKESKLQ